MCDQRRERVEVGSMAHWVSNAHDKNPELGKLHGGSDQGKVIGVGRSGRARVEAALRGTINTLLAGPVGMPSATSADNYIRSTALLNPAKSTTA